MVLSYNDTVYWILADNCISYGSFCILFVIAKSNKCLHVVLDRLCNLLSPGCSSGRGSLESWLEWSESSLKTVDRSIESWLPHFLCLESSNSVNENIICYIQSIHWRQYRCSHICSFKSISSIRVWEFRSIVYRTIWAHWYTHFLALIFTVHGPDAHTQYSWWNTECI